MVSGLTVSLPLTDTADRHAGTLTASFLRQGYVFADR